MDVVRWIGGRLETGSAVLPLTVARPLGALWDAVASRSVVRRLDLRGVEAPVVTIGGATLGGSGKTPVALACARELAASGAAVAIVGHAYRARPERARVVAPDDDVLVVGDESLALARATASSTPSVRVVVGPTRADALALAQGLADVLVIDGVLQTAPRRADLSILAVDAHAPWGAGSAPPRGDRRAPPAALLEACDVVVAIALDDSPLPPFARAARVDAAGARVSSHLLTWQEIGALPVGLFTALARPERVLRLLAARGVVPRVHVAAGDHRGPSLAQAAAARAAVREMPVALWLASSKCATHLGRELGGAPVAVLDYALRLHPAVGQMLRAVGAGRVKAAPSALRAV